MKLWELLWGTRKESAPENDPNDLRSTIQLGRITWRDAGINSDYDRPDRTEARVVIIKERIAKVRKKAKEVVLGDVLYSNLSASGATLLFKLEDDKTVKMDVGVGMFMEEWLDKKKLIEPDTRTWMDTVGTYHTREMIFLKKPTPEEFLDMVVEAMYERAGKKWREEAGREEILGVE